MRGAKFANGLITTIDFMEKRRAALVLAGGGARGVAHIGAIEELEREAVIPCEQRTTIRYQVSEMSAF